MTPAELVTLAEEAIAREGAGGYVLIKLPPYKHRKHAKRRRRLFIRSGPWGDEWGPAPRGPAGVYVYRFKAAEVLACVARFVSNVTPPDLLDMCRNAIWKYGRAATVTLQMAKRPWDEPTPHRRAIGHSGPRGAFVGEPHDCVDHAPWWRYQFKATEVIEWIDRLSGELTLYARLEADLAELRK